MAQPLINGTAYVWADIELYIGGRKVNGIDKITYKEGREKQDNFGAGSRPVSRGYGRIKAEGSLALHWEEIAALIETSPQRSLASIAPFVVTVTFLTPGATTATVHVLNNVEFMDTELSTNEGDMKIAVDLPLLISHITW